MAGHHGIALVASCVLTLFEEGRKIASGTSSRIYTFHVTSNFPRYPFIGKLWLNVNLDRVEKYWLQLTVKCYHEMLEGKKRYLRPYLTMVRLRSLKSFDLSLLFLRIVRRSNLDKNLTIQEISSIFLFLPRYRSIAERERERRWCIGLIVAIWLVSCRVAREFERLWIQVDAMRYRDCPFLFRVRLFAHLYFWNTLPFLSVKLQL